MPQRRNLRLQKRCQQVASNETLGQRFSIEQHKELSSKKRKLRTSRGSSFAKNCTLLNSENLADTPSNSFKEDLNSLKVPGSDLEPFGRSFSERKWFQGNWVELKFEINENQLVEEQFKGELFPIKIEPNERLAMKEETFNNSVSSITKERSIEEPTVALSNDHKANTTCDICGKTMQSTKQEAKHMKHEHTPEFDRTTGGWYKCKICPETRMTKPLMLRHVATNHENKYSCDICNKLFPSKMSFSNHVKKAHPSKSSVCKICNYTFDLYSEFKNHSKTKCGSPIQCPNCHALFKSTKNLNKHIKSHKREGLFCDICGKLFKSQTNLNSHIKNFHTKYFDMTYSGDFMCKLCQMVLNNKINIIKHVVFKHEAVIRNMCSLCGQTFDSQELTTHHIRTRHAQGQFICENCGRGFRKEHTFAKHRQKHC